MEAMYLAKQRLLQKQRARLASAETRGEGNPRSNDISYLSAFGSQFTSPKSAELAPGSTLAPALSPSLPMVCVTVEYA